MYHYTSYLWMQIAMCMTIGIRARLTWIQYIIICYKERIVPLDNFIDIITFNFNEYIFTRINTQVHINFKLFDCIC